MSGLTIDMATAAPSATVFATRKVSKRFGATLALREVDLNLGRGQILAMFGENGAGKSTLVRILSGAIAPDSGQLLLEGELTHLRHPREALRHGISLVPQELAGCNDLCVAENIFAGHLPSRHGLTGRTQILRAAEELCARFEIEVPVGESLGSLTLADRQLVEILKGLSRKTKVLLLDEPTATLTDTEATRVLGQVRRLTRLGVSTILITHRISEALSVADTVLVLRNGEVVHSGDADNVSQAAIVAHMLGGKAQEGLTRTRVDRTNAGPTVLRLRNWRVGGTSPLHGLDLDVSSNEIVGVYGLRGSGIESVAEGLAGNLHRLTGRVALEDSHREYPSFRSPRERRKRHIAYVPSERRATGVVLPLSVRDNLLFSARPRWSHWIGIRRQRVEAIRCRAIIQEFDIRCQGDGQRVAELSGGNQQKVLIASRLLENQRVVVLHEPTRGVDIGARESIHRRIRSLGSSGVGVLLLSSDIDEIVAISDRVIVLRRGHAVGEFTRSEVTKDSILIAASGRDV